MTAAARLGDDAARAVDCALDAAGERVVCRFRLASDGRVPSFDSEAR